MSTMNLDTADNKRTDHQSTIGASEAAERLRSGNAVLIDVRTPAEFRAVHAEGAVNCPLDSLSPRQIVDQHASSGEEILLICKSGNRSTTAMKAFHDAGIDRAISVEGGTQTWEWDGLPVERGRQAMSLDRQMRITAGSLVFAGVVIGWLWHPLGFVLSGFMGAGLVYAGVTDSCPMSWMLAKMPWNR